LLASQQEDFYSALPGGPPRRGAGGGPSVFETLRRGKKSAIAKKEQPEEQPAHFAFLFRKTYWGAKEIISPEVLAHDKIAHHYLLQQVSCTCNCRGQPRWARIH
jgi:hypothetical protein